MPINTHEYVHLLVNTHTNSWILTLPREYSHLLVSTHTYSWILIVTYEYSYYSWILISVNTHPNKHYVIHTNSPRMYSLYSIFILTLQSIFYSYYESVFILTLQSIFYSYYEFVFIVMLRIHTYTHITNPYLNWYDWYIFPLLIYLPLYIYKLFHRLLSRIKALFLCSPLY